MDKNKQKDSLEGIHSELINIRNSLKNLDGIASSVFSLSTKRDIEKLFPGDFQKQMKEAREEERRDMEVEALRSQVRESREQTKVMKRQIQYIALTILLTILGLIISIYI